MRIVHDIDGPPEVCMGAEVYAKTKGKKVSSGFKVSLTVFSRFPWPDAPTEELNIEGSAKYVRAFLEEALYLVDMCGEGYVKSGDIAPDWKKIVRPGVAKKAKKKPAKKKAGVARRA